jgi:hypothetical protein
MPRVLGETGCSSGFDTPVSPDDRRMQIVGHDRLAEAGPVSSQAGKRNPGPRPGCGLGARDFPAGLQVQKKRIGFNYFLQEFP